MNRSLIEPTDVLNAVLAKHHGWWYQSIDDTLTEPRLAVDQHFFASEGMYRIYNLSPDEPLVPNSKRISSLYSKAEFGRLTSIIAAVLKRGSSPQSDIFDVDVPNVGKKRIVIFAQRITLADNTTLFFSMHFEATASDLTWLDRTVLDRINAFVFVKEFVPRVAETPSADGCASRSYKFRYVNPQLADALGMKHRQVVGRTDGDFFSAKACESFLQVDNQVRESDNPNIIDSREEDFAPNGQPSRTLWTTKLKYRPPGEHGHDGEDQVLGIAIDITGRLHVKSLAQQDFLEVVLVPSSNESLVFDSYLLA